jgi:protein involved in polysaccharide export with SLBB domain
MRTKHKTLVTLRFGVLCVALPAILTGCAMLPPNSFLDPTRVGMFPLEYREGGIRRVLTPREGPVGLANATEPTPEDLVVSYEEYRIGPMDEVALIINDLIQSGFPYTATVEVSPTGYIRVPEIGLLKVTGMTDRELEQDITARLQEAGLLPDPVVQVFVITKRQQYFNVIGAASRPGSYALAQPDTRLLDVLGLVGDIDPLSQRAYIVRRTEFAPQAPAPTPSPVPTEPDEGLIIPPPDDDDDDAFEGLLSVRLGYGLQEPPTDEPEALPDEQDLEEIIAPPGPATAPASEQVGEPQERRFAPLIFDPTTGTLKEAPAEQAPVMEQPTAEPRLEEPAERPEFDWEAIPEYELSQRVIEIDVGALKSGDPRYNVVIRPRDMINIPVSTGVFYMMGEVARPGVFSFGGREITIKQAIATVGGFGRLAWPSRCEIIRREKGTDKQITVPVNLDHVFAGLEDDILLRDDDIVNVGTDFIAPFLFVIRNSFRFTYGFGFVYDRNFADKDAYGAQINPETLEIQRRQQQGLPF